MVATFGDGFEGSGGCVVRVVIEESGVSKSSRHGAKRLGGLYGLISDLDCHCVTFAV